MTSPTGSSTTSEEEDNEMDVEEEPVPPPRAGVLQRSNDNLALLLRDDLDWLSHIRALRETDVIILLTPVVPPTAQDPENSSDPFEPLGHSIARRHSRVRHVPYTQRNGITSTHLGFIKRGHVVILCFTIRPDEQIPFEVADIAFAVNDKKPCIIVVCCSPAHAELDLPFPTLIQCLGYSPPALEATARLIFGEDSVSRVSPTPGDIRSPRLWQIDQWDEARDLQAVHRLWTQCISSQFALDRETLASLLRRPGYAKHYVVRHPSRDDILGFCATYLSYVDQEGEKLIASLAVLLVPPGGRHKGIGLSLHGHAISQLKRTRGVVRLQLGSTYPRILPGLPFDMEINEDWFRRRGWRTNNASTHDLLLNFDDWHTPAKVPSSNITYRQCTQGDMEEVLVLVEKAAVKQEKTGWFDQYSSLIGGPNVKDVVLGLEGNTIIAAALTYTPSCGSQISLNLPWAGQIGNDVGGVSCICVYRISLAFDQVTPKVLQYLCVVTDVRLLHSYYLMSGLLLGANADEATAIGLLNASIDVLREQGMERMFLDGVTGGIEDLVQLGFQQWARYRDSWKDV